MVPPSPVVLPVGWLCRATGAEDMTNTQQLMTLLPYHPQGMHVYRRPHSHGTPLVTGHVHLASTSSTSFVLVV